MPPKIHIGMTETQMKHPIAENEYTHGFLATGRIWVGTGFFGCRRKRDFLIGAREENVDGAEDGEGSIVRRDLCYMCPVESDPHPNTLAVDETDKTIYSTSEFRPAIFCAMDYMLFSSS